MQFIKTALSIAFFIATVPALAQTTYFYPNSKDQILLERLEILQQKNSTLNFSGIRPFSRKAWVNELLRPDSSGSEKLTAVDQNNRQRALMNNQEWLPEEYEPFDSRKSWWNTFYKTPSDFIQVKSNDFFLSVNPVLQVKVAKETENDETLFLNSRGLVVRGLIGKKVGFFTYLTENQERTPNYVKQKIDDHHAVPGAGFYKWFKGSGVDYFDARGYITFNAAKYIDIQFGYDRNFLGSGYRSLFLSDVANSNLFLKLNTKVWKLNYQNLFMELTPGFMRGGNDDLLPKKYASMHHLSINVTKWLNVGLFEAVVFGRKDHFDFTYLNPIIFLRSIEQQNGSPDNAIAGIDLKANIAGRFQLYSQILLDEFKLSEIRSGKGWWANKWGLQLGAKYVNAFGIGNLDLQGEINMVRPFTYTFRDSVANYTHYNQALAHPLGANFRELVGLLRYQPLNKLYLNARLIYANHGVDTAGKNFGNNIFLPYTTRELQYGNNFGNAVTGKLLNLSFDASYEIKENLFFEFSVNYRKTNAAAAGPLPLQSTVVSGGIRLNMAKRVFDF